MGRLSTGKSSSFVHDNGLIIALMGLFAVSAVGQALAGWHVDATERVEHGQAAVSLLVYLGGGPYLSSVFENWESEFLQMWAYVMLTAYLVQRGSPESKDPDETAPQDRDPVLDRHKPDAPGAVKAGRLARTIYSHSLGLALFALFVASFALHWLNSARAAADEAAQHGAKADGVWAYLGDAQLWFESFQNWQSEFLSTAVLVALSIYLREWGSAQSKGVGDPHTKTGS